MAELIELTDEESAIVAGGVALAVGSPQGATFAAGTNVLTAAIAAQSVSSINGVTVSVAQIGTALSVPPSASPQLLISLPLI